MTGSPIFSVNLTNQKNPANLNYHMSIKKSQAILKRSIDLKFSVWTRLVYAGLRKRNHVLWHLELFSAFSSSFLFPLSSFLLPPSSFLFPLSYCQSFSVLKILTGSRPEKGCNCRKTRFRFLSPERKPNAKLETSKSFQNRLTFLHQYMIV